MYIHIIHNIIHKFTRRKELHTSAVKFTRDGGLGSVCARQSSRIYMILSRRSPRPCF
ncbi:Uncharacterized protein FWK35_00012449 [Aphis craccivora]|uniref:Uncharacterized protein n=1 Tax=Aphis craccivora TaxID=307492 RepID=A0A6G0Z583_APHCR|nr:Uncharacterized protein FWK35_00012449 [Aphis craccivora]